MDQFTPVASTLGGILIGLAATVLLLSNGRIAGVSGVVGHALVAPDGDRSWRLLFIAGLVTGGLLFALISPGSLAGSTGTSVAAVAVAGVLVGFGTRLGGGCPSGHGICGIARLSSRSIVATLTFMLTGGVTVFVVRHLLGGGS